VPAGLLHIVVAAQSLPLIKINKLENKFLTIALIDPSDQLVIGQQSCRDGKKEYMCYNFYNI